MKKTAVFLFSLAFLCLGKTANAAVFSNLNESSATFGSSNIQTCLNNCGTVGNDRSFSFQFSSSTLQLELFDLSLRAYSPTAAGTYSFLLSVTTDKGIWNSSTTLSLPLSDPNGVTTTFAFPYPHPYASPGSNWSFNVSGISNGTSTQQVFFKLTNTTDTQVTILDQYGTLEGHSDYRSLYPYSYLKYRINDTDEGAITYIIPDNTNYAFTTGTATGQDFGYFGNMLRDVFLYLFQPNTGQINYQLEEIKTSLGIRFPFSYVVSVINALEDNAYRVSSSTPPILQIDLPHTTSTSFGNYMPTTWIAFSTSTVYSYGSPSTWSFLRWLMSLAMYVAVINFVFFGALRLLKPNEE